MLQCHPNSAFMLLSASHTHDIDVQEPASVRQLDPGCMQLLRFVAAGVGHLTASYDPGSPDILVYPYPDRAADIVDLADALQAAGLLRARFEEKLNLCPQCRSGRVLVRDECPVCTSSNLQDHLVLHHFRCACQAPEKDFRHADGHLRCPKCRQDLHDVSIDYEVSSGYCQCVTCNETSIQPRLGFRCLDCAHCGTGEDLAERDVYSYEITTSGLAAVNLQVT